MGGDPSYDAIVACMSERVRKRLGMIPDGAHLRVDRLVMSLISGCVAYMPCLSRGHVCCSLLLEMEGLRDILYLSRKMPILESLDVSDVNERVHEVEINLDR